MEKSFMADLYVLPAKDAWKSLFQCAWEQLSKPVRADIVDAQTTERDRAIAVIDNLLSGSAWDLWQHYETSAPRTSETLKQFWRNHSSSSKAIFILDALSLREVPWLLEQAQQKGFTIHSAGATGSELPGDTTPFAKAMGFGQRSALENGKGKSQYFEGAWTESVGMPFADCIQLIKAEPNIIFWHHWPDSQIHDLAEQGDGYRTLAKLAAEQLISDDFWNLVDRLATGRRLVITADHGYAHSGLFPDVVKQDQRDFLKNRFKSGRSVSITNNDDPHHWVPPLTQTIQSQYGTWDFVLGRKKWKSQGGYPTLTHGGLSILEVAVPYIELSK